jgi:hypothetical protein
MRSGDSIVQFKHVCCNITKQYKMLIEFLKSIQGVAS